MEISQFIYNPLLKIIYIDSKYFPRKYIFVDVVFEIKILSKLYYIKIVDDYQKNIELFLDSVSLLGVKIANKKKSYI